MFLARYGWVPLLACTLINVPFVWRRVRPYMSAHPELASGYRRLIRWLAFWMSLPWLMIGIGSTVGEVPTLLDFLRPIAGGPFVLAFWLVAYSEFLLLGWWAIWRAGAETLVRHPGVINFRADSVRKMRFYLAGLAAFAIIWSTALLIWLA